MTLTFVRRFSVLIVLMFWQGGFTFYTAVVVPVGTEVLGSALDQGFITRRVTTYLNIAGAVALPFLAWDTLANRSFRNIRGVCWLGLALTLLALAFLHVRLDAHLEPVALSITRREDFRVLHRGYLWISTTQWAFGVVFAAATLLAWRSTDSNPTV